MCKENKIFNYLISNGCCKVCGLRYLCDRTINFGNIEEYMKEKDILTDSATEIDPQVKKSKSNPCIICLGLLQDCVMDDVINQVLLSEVQKYDTTVFTCSVSIPAATLIREHTMRLMLRVNFPEYYENGLWADLEEMPLNKTWKLIIKDKLSKKLNRTFENSDICNFSVNIVMDYSDNNEELSVVRELTSSNKRNIELYSRKSVSNILADCLPEKFKKVVYIPPEIPTKYLTCKFVECKHNAVYLAGRYCKYSRNLCQSPWIIDGVKAMEYSVEEIIFEQINQVLNVPSTNLKFSSSGREDCDVRCLGKGRPFYIEIIDPKKTIFTFEEFRQLETKINESPLIKVRDLQSVPRDELVKIKEGEEKKTKDYIALCHVKGSISQEQIDQINKVAPIKLQQKTPIRVLHRRPVAVRHRKINKMKANLIPGKDNLFELHVETEAGTYVKEFVHGDFGRTKPSIGDIINTEVDIIALDVVAINLDWPKEIEN